MLLSGRFDEKDVVPPIEVKEEQEEEERKEIDNEIESGEEEKEMKLEINNQDAEIKTQISSADEDMGMSEVIETFDGFKLTSRSNLVSPKPNAIFALSATRKTWTEKHDWISGSIPCGDNLEIVLNSKKKRHTPLIQRITYLRTKSRCKLSGQRRRDPLYMNAILHVAVMRGDLANEEV